MSARLRPLANGSVRARSGRRRRCRLDGVESGCAAAQQVLQSPSDDTNALPETLEASAAALLQWNGVLRQLEQVHGGCRQGSLVRPPGPKRRRALVRTLSSESPSRAHAQEL